MPPRFRWSVAAPLVLLAAASAGRAQEETVESLRRRMDEMERRHEEERKALRAEIEALRAGGRAKAPAPGGDLREQVEEYMDRTEDLERKVQGLGKPRPTVRLLDLSLNALFAAGTSTASEAEIGNLEGGGHDPHKRGFTAQNIELGFTGAVDPYLRGDAFLVTQIDPGGGTVVELEEAYLTTTSLPWGLQVRAGQFFTGFGRVNASHPHSWDFVDQPVVNTRMFGGDGMRGPGAQVSWLAPTDFPLEISASAQNANGETMASFLGEDPVGGHPTVGRPVSSLADLACVTRAFATFDLSDTTVVLPGVSGAFGPNNSGTDGRTRILGADLTLKWKPLANDHGFPFVAWQTEVMRRRYAADPFLDPVTAGSYVPGDVLHDTGWYSQVVWGFSRDWTLGIRHDFADGDGPGAASDPFRDRRSRESVALTWYLSEFSRLRLQANRDRAQHMGPDALSIWLQWEINLGAHGAHRF